MKPAPVIDRPYADRILQRWTAASAEARKCKEELAAYAEQLKSEFERVSKVLSLEWQPEDSLSEEKTCGTS